LAFGTRKRFVFGRRLAVAAIAGGAVLAAASAAYAGAVNVTFTDVADTAGHGFTGFSTFPAINNAGAVAFEASRTGIGQGVFRSQDGALTTIASGVGVVFSSFGMSPAINTGGVVAFFAGLAGPGNDAGIFTGDGSVTTTIVDANKSGLVARFLGDPSINASGTVAFDALRAQPGNPAVVFTGSGEGLTIVADTTTKKFSNFGNAAINGSGTVAFLGILPPTNPAFAGIFTGPGGTTKIADGTDLGAISPGAFGDPVINNAGTAADEVFPDNGGVEIVTGDGGPISVRADPSVFSFSEHPSINNAGDVAFFADKFDGTEGIFAELTGGASPIPVISVGDSLFGSTVTSVDLGRFALNDSDQLAFMFMLQDGRSGVAIADIAVPEPGSLALLLPALGILAGLWARAHRDCSPSNPNKASVIILGYLRRN
jgi:hypothetical protein